MLKYRYRALFGGGARGFTLAEVLITLGVIGIVAAMTLPIVIAKYQKVVATSQLKRIYSLLANAEILSVEDNGASKYWTYPISTLDEDTGKITAPISNTDFFKKYYDPYLRTSGALQKIYGMDTYYVSNYNGANAGFDDNSIARGNVVRFADGAWLSIWSNNQYVVLTVDLNGNKPPNIIGRDVFDVAELYWEGNKKLVIPSLNTIKKAMDRESYLERCRNFSYVHGGASACFAIFVHDGWQFKDDYPWKI